MSYWDTIEAALTCLPESNSLRSEALASFDHLKERVTVTPTARREEDVEALRLIRDGTIWAPDRTEIDFRTPDYRVWITVKAEKDSDAEAMADVIESTFGTEGGTTGHGTATGSGVGSPGCGASPQEEVGTE